MSRNSRRLWNPATTSETTRAKTYEHTHTPPQRSEETQYTLSCTHTHTQKLGSTNWGTHVMTRPVPSSFYLHFPAFPSPFSGHQIRSPQNTELDESWTNPQILGKSGPVFLWSSLRMSFACGTSNFTQQIYLCSVCISRSMFMIGSRINAILHHQIDGRPRSIVKIDPLSQYIVLSPLVLFSPYRGNLDSYRQDGDGVLRTLHQHLTTLPSHYHGRFQHANKKKPRLYQRMRREDHSSSISKSF